MSLSGDTTKVTYASTRMRRRNLSLAVCAAGSLAAAIVSACADFSPFRGTSNGEALDGDVALDGGAEASADASLASDGSTFVDAGMPSGTCTALHPPTLVAVGDECIDSTEVTYAQYMQMLADLDGGAGPATGCPRPSVPGKTGCVAPALSANQPDEPITCVTLCDAEHYCVWAGKHLCGPRDGGSPGGPVGPFTDEWTYACTSGGTGSGPDPSTCALTPSQLRKVGLGCEGPPGVFDLLGNAEEWTATPRRDAGEFRAAGDSFDYTSSPGGRSCISDDALPSTSSYVDTGFRCCGN
jgi:hypothetical protein